MLYTFRFEGKKYAYDSASGAIIRPDALQFKMLNAIQPPLNKACPTSLRYELAKFDSLDVEDAYNKIYALFEAGILYAPESSDGCIRVITDGEYAFSSDGLMAAALQEAFSTAPTPICFVALGSGADQAKKVASEVAARIGKSLQSC